MQSVRQRVNQLLPEGGSTHVMLANIVAQLQDLTTQLREVERANT